jgi:hypothetical protein
VTPPGLQAAIRAPARGASFDASVSGYLIDCPCT